MGIIDIQYHLFISGRVQGVSYRYSAMEIATDLGLTGWVKNLADGRVEILAEGTEDALDQFLLWTKQGPRFAKVERVTLAQKVEVSTTRTEFKIH